MITLKDAVLAAQTDLQVLRLVGINLYRPLEMLSGILSSLPEGGDAPILLAKDACEAIIDCAHDADDADHPALAENLRCVNRALSTVVARSYRDVHCGGIFLRDIAADIHIIAEDARNEDCND